MVNIRKLLGIQSKVKECPVCNNKWSRSFIRLAHNFYECPFCQCAIDFDTMNVRTKKGKVMSFHQASISVPLRLPNGGPTVASRSTHGSTTAPQRVRHRSTDGQRHRSTTTVKGEKDMAFMGFNKGNKSVFTARTKCPDGRRHRGKMLSRCENCNQLLGYEDFARPEEDAKSKERKTMTKAKKKAKLQASGSTKHIVNDKQVYVKYTYNDKTDILEIACMDCGKKRQIKSQDLFQVKRCAQCQAKNGKKKQKVFFDKKGIKTKSKKAVVKKGKKN